MTTGSTPDDPSINGSRVNERARPSTAGTIHDSTSVHHFAPPEASHDPIPPFSALTTAHPNHFPGHPISINTNTYSDELSFHTTSYNGSYDSSYSNSPWSVDPQPQSRSLQYYPVSAMSQMSYRSDHPYKQDEPILAPGEIPAPRPPMSYAALIGEALLLAPPPHNLYVSEISDSIKRRNACESVPPSFLSLHVEALGFPYTIVHTPSAYPATRSPPPR